MPQAAYTVFADIYDVVMRDVQYDHWADYIIRLARKHHFSTESVLNLACGTGNLELQLVPRGFSMEGLDGSEDMLARAREKFAEQGLEVPLQQGDLRSFTLGKSFPLILCLYDSLNYLCSEEEVLSCFMSVAAHLPRGGGFIFDVTTEYNILTNFSNYTFAENFPRFAYIWENTYNLASKICISDVTVFQADDSGERFARTTERHRQRMYPQKVLRGLLSEAGFALEAAYDGMTESSPGRRTERIHMVCRKAKP